MKAIVHTNCGQPELLHLKEIEKPVETAEAYEYVETGQKTGDVVITVRHQGFSKLTGQFGCYESLMPV